MKRAPIPVLRTLAVPIALLPAVALADMTGQASVIDGDKLEIHGRRIRLHAIEAGVVVHRPTNPVAVVGNPDGGVTGLKCLRMRLGESDAPGRTRPRPSTWSRRPRAHERPSPRPD